MCVCVCVCVCSETRCASPSFCVSVAQTGGSRVRPYPPSWWREAGCWLGAWLGRSLVASPGYVEAWGKNLYLHLEEGEGRERGEGKIYINVHGVIADS